MPKFPNENAFDDIIAEVVAEYTDDGVTVPIVKAIIATESGFKPTAWREEPHLKLPDGTRDGSRGLMQILLRTARGVGFSGQPSELFDPRVNVTYGVKHLAGLARTKRNIVSAISAYNNGNGKIATKETVVCLERNADGSCRRSFTAKVGQYFNQPYVDKVLGWLSYFGGTLPTAQAGGGALGLLLLVGLVLAGRVVRVT